jgi:hypothetical protein
LKFSEIRRILKELEVSREADVKSKDLDRIVTNNYHPNGVIVHRGLDGVKTFYGSEGLLNFYATIFFTQNFPGQKEAYRPFLLIDNTDSPITTTYAESSGDGEFIIQRGTYRAGSNTKEHPFETIFQKLNDKYLIYHEDYSYFPDSPQSIS